MNTRQRAYDSYDITVKMLKISNNQYHSQNLYSIKTRKNRIPTTMSYQIKHLYDPMNEYFKNRSDLYISNKLKKISGKKTVSLYY